VGADREGEACTTEAVEADIGFERGRIVSQFALVSQYGTPGKPIPHLGDTGCLRFAC
jgi:hypothetical protein